MDRIRSIEIAADIQNQAGTDNLPELALSDILQPIIFAPQKPPLASSGYEPGTVGLESAAVALNTSHVGIFIIAAPFGADAIGRINWILITNLSGGTLTYTVRRLDNVTGFTAAPAVPGYTDAGQDVSGRISSLVRNNVVAAQGVEMFSVQIPNAQSLRIPGPWIINSGAMLVAPSTVNKVCRAAFGYESWPSFRRQPVG